MTPLSPDRAVAQILDHALFLWEPDFAFARRALVGLHRRDGTAAPWVAGPASWRRRLRARKTTWEALERLVTTDGARDLWPGISLDGDGTGNEDVDVEERAGELWARGRLDDALALLEPLPDTRALGLRVRTLQGVGRLGAARNLLHRVEEASRSLSMEETVPAAEAAVRVAAAIGDDGLADVWAERARSATTEGWEGEGSSRWVHRATLVAAAAAFDRGDVSTLRDRLDAARSLRDDPDDGWRWLQVAALAHLADEPASAVELLREALGRFRRSLGRLEAGGLWNDLGVARAAVDDLAGAERAFLHCVRQFERCDGPRATTLALQNLAEVRLRRGRVRGVRELLERARIENRRIGNTRGEIYDAALEARFELAHGRPEAALAACKDALDHLDRLDVSWQEPTLRLLAARALGWLGRTETARRYLESVSPKDLAEIEPEERPALWALAGDRERALRETAEIDGPARDLWRRLLTDGTAPGSVWERLGTLEDFRLARLVFDAERVAPGTTPEFMLRRAAAVARHRGGGLLAERLEARDGGPWTALTKYLESPHPTTPESLGALFEAAGAGAARLWWERGDERVEVLLDGPGGAEEVVLPAHGGRLVLRVACREPALEALLRLVRRDFEPDRPTAEIPEPGGMVGDSPALRDALTRLDRLATSDLPVLIHGESGTGKELAARRVHDASRRRENHFVPVNCAALSDTLILSELFGHVRGAFTGAERDRAGVFETGSGGTVFLDEIGDLPAQAQGMLLRVLQEGEVRRLGETLPRKVDVRVVAATHRDLEARVDSGDFRRDLYFRLRGAQVTLPPLRDRGDDVLRLAEHLLARTFRGGGTLPTLSEAARARLSAHDWPGNVRELGHVLEAAVALSDGDLLEPEHLDLPTSRRDEAAGTAYHARVDALRRRLVSDALEAAGGNQAEAARRLGLSRQSMSYLVKKFGLG